MAYGMKHEIESAAVIVILGFCSESLWFGSDADVTKNRFKVVFTLITFIIQIFFCDSFLVNTIDNGIRGYDNVLESLIGVTFDQRYGIIWYKVHRYDCRLPISIADHPLLSPIHRTSFRHD